MHQHPISPESQLFWCALAVTPVLMGLAERLCVYLARSEKTKKRISVSFAVATAILIIGIVGIASDWNALALLVVAAILGLAVLLRKYNASIRRHLEDLGKTKL